MKCSLASLKVKSTVRDNHATLGPDDGACLAADACKSLESLVISVANKMFQRLLRHLFIIGSLWPLGRIPSIFGCRLGNTWMHAGDEVKFSQYMGERSSRLI